MHELPEIFAFILIPFMHIAGYIASALIGLSLGLIGAGGSILTVPVLVYLFGLTPVLATSYSLFVVGTSSFAGALANLRKGLVNTKIAALFSVSSLFTVYLTRKKILPLIPETLFSIHHTAVTESMLTMILFAILMLFSAVSMITGKEKISGYQPGTNKLMLPKLIFYGVGIGFVTGFLGAGGGFLLIPALVLVVGLPMKKAVGTSLLIIAINSLVGFTGDLGHFTLDFAFLFRITLIAMSGIIAGNILSQKIPGNTLKKGFGWLVMVMGLGILAKETLLK